MTTAAQHTDPRADQRQYAISTQDTNFNSVFNWVLDNDIPYELHLARVRFRPHLDTLRTQYYLQYSEMCYAVEPPYPTVF